MVLLVHIHLRVCQALYFRSHTPAGFTLFSLLAVASADPVPSELENSKFLSKTSIWAELGAVIQALKTKPCKLPGGNLVLERN